MNKKGNIVLAFGLFIIILVAFAIISQLTFKSFSDIQADISGDLSTNESKKVISDVNTRYPATLDGLIMIVFTGLFILGIVAGMNSDSHPILFGFMLFVGAFMLVAGALLSNSYQEMFQDTDLVSMTSTFPVTFWIISHLVEVGVVMVLSTLLAAYAKNKG